MALPQPEERETIDQVLRLVNKLSPSGQLEIRQQLDSKTWGDRFKQLVSDVAEDLKNKPLITEEEINQEVTAYRREKRSQGA